MGNNAKASKLKHDRFYRLAKETGYRSRAAFKLIQLNRKFGFLNDARVVVDLCAAPGGWLQVAASVLPVSGVIIGVDLAPIKSIRNVMTLVGDITTDACSKEIQNQLQNWKADVVLHDGAPNLGRGWAADSFGQAQLTLAAVRLMSKILTNRGCFVTKIFRSRDYMSMTKLLRQLFKHIHSTKPIASRSESAEIFVVCQDFVGLQNIDPSILSFKNVFKENDTPKAPLTLKKLIKNKRPSRDGYADDVSSLVYRRLPVSEFLTSESPLEVLSTSSEFILDDPRFEPDSLTPPLIKECFKDVRILGLLEIKSLLAWRKRMIKIFKLHDASTNEQITAEENSEAPLVPETEEQELERVSNEERRELKKEGKKRKNLERKQKAISKKAAKQVSCAPDESADAQLFSLSSLKSLPHLKNLLKSDIIIDDLPQFDSNNEEDCELDRKLSVVQTKIAEKRSPFVMVDPTPLPDTLEVDDAVEADVDFLLGKKRKHSKSEPLGLIKLDQLERKVLSPEELALGEYIREEPRHKKALIEENWNRYMRDEKERLPSFFRQYEETHLIRTLPITKEKVEFYRQKQYELNSRPIKKVLEAKDRKRRKQTRILEKTKTQAERLLAEEGLFDCDKVDQVKRLYKKAGKALKAKPKTKLIVAKKGLANGRRYKKPSGIKGPVKVVDRRMKKDKRNDKFSKQNKKRSKSRMRRRR